LGRPGRPRKDPDNLSRRSKLAADLVPHIDNTPMKLPPWDGVRRGPSLLDKTPEGHDWHTMTRDWWMCWRESPQAMFMGDTDWHSLLVAAVIHNRICWGTSNTALAALSGELRQRESRIGASIEDRRRLGLGDAGDGITPAAQEAAIERDAEVIVDYFTRLTERVAEDNPGG